MTVETTAEEFKTQANDLFKQKEFIKAINMYTKAIDLDSGNAVYYSNRGASYLQVQEYTKALQDCLTSRKIDPNFTKSYFRASKCQLHLGNLNDAMEQLKSASSCESTNISDASEQIAKEMNAINQIKTLINGFQELWEQRSYKSALMQLEKAMKLVDPSLSGTQLPNSLSSVDTSLLGSVALKWRLWRAELLISCFDYDEATQIANAILRKDSRNADAIFLRVKTMHLLDSHPFPTIQQYIAQCLTFDPDHQDARSLLKRIRQLESIKKSGNDFFKQGSYQDALEEYNRFLNENPEGISKVKVLSNRATVYSKLSKHEECVQDCISCIELLDKISIPNANDQNPVTNEDRKMSNHHALYFKVFLRSADSNQNLENFENAIRDYEAASILKPEDREVKQAVHNAKKLFEMSKRKDYYKILGVSRDASEREIKAAYRKLALVYHPDRQTKGTDEEIQVAESKFKEVSEAYEVLTDPRKKQMFDAGHNIDGSSASAGQNPFGGQFNQEDIFAHFARSGGFGGQGFHFG